jgi:hypothetical protein
MKDDERGEAITSEVVGIGTDAEGDRVTSLVVLETDTTPTEKGRPKLSRNEQTMLAILHNAKRLTTSDWNERAREAGIGEKRKADLYDIRERLKAKGLVTQLGDQWSIKHEVGTA